MKRRLARQPDHHATIGRITERLSSEPKPVDHREWVQEFAAPQGKVCTGGTRKSRRRISGYLCDYLAPLTTAKK
ncbi:hypothetical protein [Dysgonomonas sp. 521]|uniref:hypothetical protein n=1 Tax=Dysgonomonas sp. 521 TaxID=2302932 RepID=UPI0013D635CE|nr:hypothetical protein [Dysgonomonas sp. 521]